MWSCSTPHLLSNIPNRLRGVAMYIIPENIDTELGEQDGSLLLYTLDLPPALPFSCAFPESLSRQYGSIFIIGPP